MTQTAKLKSLLDEIKAEGSVEHFAALLNKGCQLLGYDDTTLAVALDTSRPNASRWVRGVVVPPAAPLVLRILCGCIEQRIQEMVERAHD